MTETVKNQILAVRATGKVNMFSLREVFDLAMELDHMELCDYLFLQTHDYLHFILTGEDSDPFNQTETFLREQGLI